jgi:cell division protein FtsI (penicillin-binding protein 3)
MNKVSNNILGRVYVLFGLFMVFGAVILLRVMALQLNSDEWLKREIEEKVFFKKVVADRGTILAEDGRILAASLPFYRIGMDPTVVDTASFQNFPDSLWLLASNLANYFGESESRKDTLEITDSTLVTQTYDYIDTLLYYNRIHGAMMRGDRHVYLTRS